MATRSTTGSEFSKNTSATCYNPLLKDSDVDGLLDGFFVANPIPLQLGTSVAPIFGWGTFTHFEEPKGTPGEDINLSGVKNGQETYVCNADSDGDGISDGIEFYEVRVAAACVDNVYPNDPDYPVFVCRRSIRPARTLPGPRRPS